MKIRLALSLALLSSLVLNSCKSGSSVTDPVITPVVTHRPPTPVGTAIGSPSSATIDASGGSVRSTDGRLDVIIPAGALSTATVLSIQPVTNEAPGGAGVGFSLTPNGQQFSQPVTLRFHYGDSDRAGTDINALAIATQKDDRIWYAFNTTTLDSAAGTLSGSTTHFSGYSLFNKFRIVPDHAQIKVNTSQALEVRFASDAPVDNDPNDDLTPLATFVTYPNASQVKWTVNGNTLGVTEDGLVSPTSGSSTTTYTAPSTTDAMSSNPAAVTAEVDLPGPSKLYLISNIKVTNGPAVSGRITLSVTLTGSQTYTHGEVETKTEDGSADFVYNLSDTILQDDGNGSRSANWDDAAFGGTARWVEEHVSTYNYICDNVKDRQVTDKETTTTT